MRCSLPRATRQNILNRRSARRNWHKFAGQFSSSSSTRNPTRHSCSTGTVFRQGGQELHFFSTITTFGTPRDVTLDELHIKCTFPVDEATAEFCLKLAREEPVP